MIIGSKKIFVEKVSSTNSHAAFLLRKEKVKEGTVIYTGFQTAGRGQPGNSWESEHGKNLLFSIILYPVTLVPENQFSISRMISLGIRDYLSRIVKEVYIKWPNDIYVSNDKIAGILIENTILGNTIEHSIAGIGININQVRFTGGAVNATSLRILTGKEHNTAGCLDELLKALDLRYRQLYHEINLSRDYISSLYRHGQWTEFRDKRGIFEGKIIDVTDDGRLQIEDRKGRIYEYMHREVDFL